LPGLKKHNQDAATQKAARTSSGIFAVDCGITKRAAQGGEAREAPARCALRERESPRGTTLKRSNLRQHYFHHCTRIPKKERKEDERRKRRTFLSEKRSRKRSEIPNTQINLPKYIYR
jgi:hypothetical protein